LVFDVAVIFDSLVAFLGFFLGQGDGGSFSLGDPCPPIIEAVQFRGVGFAGTVGFAAGTAGGGDAARQQWALARDDDFAGWWGWHFHFFAFCSCILMYISLG
jgi:hypothetical protein